MPRRNTPASGVWPVTIDDVRAAERRIRAYVAPSPLRTYPELDAAVGHGIRVLVKHENHLPTQAFKVRNAFAALTVLDDAERQRGVVAATRGNHGGGLAYAGHTLGIPVTIVVPHGNNPEKNAAMRAFGAELIEEGRDYDECHAVVARLIAERGLTPIHGTNNRDVLAGAGTIALEVLEQAPSVDAMVIAVGGGSQAVGALTVLRTLRPAAAVYGVQAAGAAAIYEGWRTGAPTTLDRADTFADGVATRSTYEMTFPALCEGLAGFVTVTDAEIAEALRLLLATTHNLVEGAGAAGLAGLMALHERLVERTVVVILSGGNIDRDTLRRVLAGEI